MSSPRTHRPRSRLSVAGAVLPALLAACSSQSANPPGSARPAAPSVDATAAKIRAALAAPHRGAKDRARDPYRHPAETLGFFGLRDDMTVVELWPGRGWYTDVLAPVLAERGKLMVATLPPDGPDGKVELKIAKAYDELLRSNPALYGKVEVHQVRPPADVSLGPDGSADLVVTFRNFHNWMAEGFADRVIAAVFRVLKSGGVLGVVEHRGIPGAPYKKESGYIPEDVVIKTVEAAGFKLADKSEVNANPKDTKDHPKGVWNLPPSLAGGDQDRDKYLAIGESDRMTLKFVKP